MALSVKYMTKQFLQPALLAAVNEMEAKETKPHQTVNELIIQLITHSDNHVGVIDNKYLSVINYNGHFVVASDLVVLDHKYELMNGSIQWLYRIVGNL